MHDDDDIKDMRYTPLLLFLILDTGGCSMLSELLSFLAKAPCHAA